MQLDNYLIFDTATIVTNASVASANVLDLTSARDLGPGARVQGFVIANQTFGASSTTGTINIQVQVCTASNGTYSTILESGALGTASLSGSTGSEYVWAFTLTKNDQNLGGQRYMRLNYVVAGSTFTTGSFQAYLADGIDLHQYYSSGFTVTN